MVPIYILIITLFYNSYFIKFKLFYFKFYNLYCLNLYQRKFSTYNDNKLDNLSYYLAGLIEGDGHLYIPKELKSSTGKTNTVSIEIVFALKDKPSADFLKSKYGGNVYIHSAKKLVRWMIQDSKSVINIVNKVNGKFRTPKINALHAMIDFINNKGNNIIKLPLDSSSLETNAWLAGFIDSDGSFMIKGFTTSSKGLRSYLALHFYLSQRINDVSGEDMKSVMEAMATFLETKLRTRDIDKKFSQYYINTSNYTSNIILVQYLKNFPLLSSKYLDFIDWEKALYMHKDKLHKDPIYFEKIRELKLNMNSNRTFFSWNHHTTDIYNLS